METKKTKENHDTIVKWIETWFKDKTGPAVIGISGGKDSTVCAALLVEALGKERVIGVMMPNGEQKDLDDSKKVCELLGIKSLTVNIGEAYKSLTGAICINLMEDVAVGNLDDEIPSLYSTNTPARLRMTTLYGVAAIFGGFVCNTCNLSESIVGWETYGGDGFGDFAPIGKLTKTEVVELGDYMKLPQELVHKAPSDGMCGATDEDKLGFTYETLDNYIREGLRPKARETFDRIMLLHKKSHFKHENIRIPTCNIDAPICEDFDWN